MSKFITILAYLIQIITNLIQSRVTYPTFTYPTGACHLDDHVAGQLHTCVGTCTSTSRTVVSCNKFEREFKRFFSRAQH